MPTDAGSNQNTTQGQGSSPTVSPNNIPPSIAGAAGALEFLRQKTNPELQKFIDPQAIASKVQEQMKDAGKDPEAPAAPVAQTQQTRPQEPQPFTEPKTEPSNVSPTSQAAKPEDPKSQEDAALSQDEILEDKELTDLIDPEELGDKKTSLRESYTHLNTKYKEVKKTLKDKETEALDLKKKLEGYETGTAIPKVLQEKENKLQKLEHFQHLVEFKTSDEYLDKIERPREAAKEKLKSKAAVYNIPMEEILEARKNLNEADFNGFLSSSFDPVGAIEVKGILDTIQELDGKALEAEKNPAKAFETLKLESQKALEIKEGERIRGIQTAAKRGWVETLQKIRSEGKHTALIYSDVDKTHNENIVRPLLNHAVQEFQKTVSLLAERGIKELPPELAEVIARGHLYGSASGVVLEAAMDAMREAETVKNNTKDLFRFQRPPVGGGAPSYVPPGAQGKSNAPDPAGAAKRITDTVLAQRRA